MDGAARMDAKCYATHEQHAWLGMHAVMA